MPSLPKPTRKAYLPERVRKPTGDQTFYNSTAWRKTTKLYRQRNPLCEVCSYMRQLEPATLTDHIVARQFGGADYTPRNLMAMCASHHDSKSARERTGLFIDAIDSPDGLVPADRVQVVERILKQDETTSNKL
jgi:5-methylcytosine-specific restriction endonuclease McrA